MARGKHATASANRRAEAAHQVIDRLTTELADAKLRAKQAEQKCAHLEGADKLVGSASIKHDEMLGAALEALKMWRRVADEDAERRRRAHLELVRQFMQDVKTLWPHPPLAEDVRQFIEMRYPLLMAALHAGAPLDGFKRPMRWKSNLEAAERKLSGEDLKRFQRLSGQRGIFTGAAEKDIAEIWIDLLDAKQVAFDPAETWEYAFGEASK